MSDEQPTTDTTLDKPDKPDRPGFDPKTITTSYEDLEKAGAKSKSQIIRYLASLGYERSAIAKFLNVKYQHVRNVLTQPLKRQIKAEREAAKLKGQHPSTLTERQKLIVAGAPEGLQPELPKTVSEFKDRIEEDEEGWMSPAAQVVPMSSTQASLAKNKRTRRK